MKKWILLRRGADYETLSEELQMDKVAIRVMVNRGITTLEEMKKFLGSDISQCVLSEGLPDIDGAVSFINEMRNGHVPVRIIGDYDVDGVCATSILMKGLKKYGLDVDFIIPHRIINGYGLSDALIDDAYNAGRKAIITCDNGISAVDAVLRAYGYGMKVLITDHHEVPKNESGEDIIPRAEFCVDPKRSTNKYAFPEICGAYVAFKLICRLFGYDKEISGEEDRIFVRELLDLAAMATVCDVMPLSGENRALVKDALAGLHRTTNPGLKKLMEVTECSGKVLEPYHISFIMGPHINATGRLDTAQRAMELLLSDDLQRAGELAKELHTINEERKEMTLHWEEKAFEIVEQNELYKKSIIVLYLKECHESLAGLVAGKVKEKYYRPTFVLTDGKESLKGSGRSIEEFDMFASMEKCKEVFIHYGGHKMAAGLSLEESKLEEFTEKIQRMAEYEPDSLKETVKIDADMPLDYVSFKLMEDLNRLEPFGNGNEKPVFARKDITILGAERKKERFVILKVSDSTSRSYKMKYFGDVDCLEQYIDEKNGAGSAEGMYLSRPCKLNMLYSPHVNEFRGNRSIEFNLLDYC